MQHVVAGVTSADSTEFYPSSHPESVALASQLAIPAAGTSTTTPVKGMGDLAALSVVFDFHRASGGTSVDAYLQTSFDNSTWFDIAHASFLTANLVRAFNVVGVGAITQGFTPTDGALAANTVQDGILGSYYRLKLVTVGAYGTGSYLSCYLQPHSAASGPKTVALPTGQATAAQSTPVVAASDGPGSIETVTLAVTTTGTAGSATGTADSAAIYGYLIDVFVDWHASAPATSDLLLLYLSPANGQILSVANSVTDDFFMPLMQAQSPSGVDLGIYGRYALNGTLQVQVAQCDALATAVTCRLRYMKAAN